MTNGKRYLLLKAFSLFLLVMPLALLVIFTSEMFITTNAAKLSVFSYFALLFVLVGFKTKIKLFAEKNTILTFSLTVFAVSFVMRYLANELVIISGVSLIGSVLSSLIEPLVSYYYFLIYEEKGSGKRKIESEDTPIKAAIKRAYLA